MEKLESDNIQPMGSNKISLKNLFLTTAFAVQSAGKQIFRHRDLKNFTYIERNSFLTMKGILNAYYPNVNLRSEYESAIFTRHEHDVSKISAEHLPREFVTKIMGSIENTNDEIIEIDENTEIEIWLDPLDGSNDFIEQMMHFVSTQACVVLNGRPIMGFIFFPFHFANRTEVEHAYNVDNIRYTSPAILTSSCLQLSWSGHGETTAYHGSVFAHNDFKDLRANENNKLITVSRSSPPDLKSLVETSLVSRNPSYNISFATYGGVGYKMLTIMSQKSDAYVHSGSINRWDICAGDAIIRAKTSGNSYIKSFSGNPLTYAKSDSGLISDGFVASLDPEFTLSSSNDQK